MDVLFHFKHLFKWFINSEENRQIFTLYKGFREIEGEIRLAVKMKLIINKIKNKNCNSNLSKRKKVIGEC